MALEFANDKAKSYNNVKINPYKFEDGTLKGYKVIPFDVADGPTIYKINN